MNTCPFFNRCGGCKYDFAAADYRDKKSGQLRDLPVTDAPIWVDVGTRRRAEFCFAPMQFGFFERRTKNIIPVRNCPNLVSEINDALPAIAALPWCGAGGCLVTACDNGIDIAITSDVAYFSKEFRAAAEKLPAIRITWNGAVIKQTAEPVVSFDDVSVTYPVGAFLQPGRAGEKAMRDLVVKYVGGAQRVADLFCGIGNFTYATGATGFDIVGIGTARDLFTHPLTPGMLNQYDCVIMDPPRAGAMAQCKEIVKSNVPRVVYVSCNPVTFRRDMEILTRAGYKLKKLTPVDQFVGSSHWELVSLFDKE